MVPMGVRKAKKESKADVSVARDPFFNQLGPFHCSYCTGDLTIERVVSATVDRHASVPTGYINIEHYCACSPAELLVSRVLGTQFGIVNLFGTPPALPYHAPFHWHDVAPDDPTVARWRWELEQVA